MSGKGEKQYGLIIPKKQQTAAPKITNVFGDDGISDEDDGTDWVRKALKAEGEKNKVKKQTKLNMQKALKEDPTIYQYDEVYDDMERTKKQSKTVKQEDKKPKYIQNLLKAAERRKKEQEHRIERTVQKEREAEGDMYADKESFVTSAYRAKLEEFKKLEEEEARMSRLESIGDVTKQQDLSGFYRHLYEQTVDDSKEADSKEADSNTVGSKAKTIPKPDHEVKDSPKEIDSTNKTSSEEVTNECNITTKVKKSRQYRQRVIDADNSDSEADNKSQENEDTNLSPQSSSRNKKGNDSDLSEPETKKQKQEIVHKEDAVAEAPIKVATETPNSEKADELAGSPKSKSQEQKEDTDAKKKLELAKMERSRIWEKRTVGPVFEAALQRYYARKAMRLSVS